MCVIKVGAHTETELTEKQHRIEDAVSATRAAIEEGIVAGGGTALTQAAAALEELLSSTTGDEAVGVRTVQSALNQPLRWIAENAGLEGHVAAAKVAEQKAGHGLDAATGEYVDLVAAGIIDPVKVTRSALRNAASIAALVLTTDTLVVDKPADEDESGDGHGHGHSH